MKCLTLSDGRQLTDEGAKKTLLPVVINRITLLLTDCEVAAERMAKKNGYTQLFEIVDSIGPPDSSTLQSVLMMATPGDKKRIRNIKPVDHLIRWVYTTDYENPSQQVWLTGAINDLCTANIQNRMLCCQVWSITFPLVFSAIKVTIFLQKL